MLLIICSLWFRLYRWLFLILCTVQLHLPQFHSWCYCLLTVKLLNSDDRHKSGLSSRTSHSFHVNPSSPVVGLIFTLISCQTCDLWCRYAADKQVTRLMFMEEMARTDCAYPEAQLPAASLDEFTSPKTVHATTLQPGNAICDMLCCTLEAPWLAYGRTYECS